METVFTSNAPAPIGPYSQAILANGMLYCSGQIALEPATGEFAGGDITAQTAWVCENIAAVLGAAGLGLADVVKTTCFLTTMGDFTAFNEVYGRYFPAKPARSCVAVKELPKAALVEIEVIAAAKRS